MVHRTFAAAVATVIAVMVALSATLPTGVAAFPRTHRFGNFDQLKVDGRHRPPLPNGPANPAGAGGATAPMGGSQELQPRTLHELTQEDERRGRHDVVVHHSLHPPYLSSGANHKLRHWDFGQDTVITDRYIRLTPEAGGRHGYLINTFKNELHAWEAIFGVFVHSRRTIGADGIAFWYRDRLIAETGGVMLGATPDFAGVGVLFDTYDNDNRRDNPRVQIVYKPKSGPLSHRRFNHENDFTPDLDSTSTDPNTIDDYGCSFNFRNFYDGDLIIAKLRYEAKEKTLRLTLRSSKSGDETPCAFLKEIDLPPGYNFGFTAQTGGVSDNHDVGFLHVTPLSTLDEDRLLEEEIKHIDEMDKPHADGFEHAAEVKDRNYWRDRSKDTEEMKQMFDKHEEELRKNKLASDVKREERAAKKTTLIIKKQEKDRMKVKETTETNNPYRAKPMQRAPQADVLAALTPPASPSPQPASPQPPAAPAHRVKSLEEHLEIHRKMKAEGSNPHQLPPHVPPPKNMAPNEELEEYRRTNGKSAEHHHHGGHKEEEVPENERRFWKRELPPRGPDGKLQRWPETVPAPAPPNDSAPANEQQQQQQQQPEAQDAVPDAAPQDDQQPQDGQAPTDAEQRSAEDEARAAAEAHAAEMAALEAEHRAQLDAHAAEVEAQAQADAQQAADGDQQHQGVQTDGHGGDLDAPSSSGDASNNGADAQQQQDGDAQQQQQQDAPADEPSAPPQQQPAAPAPIHHDAPIEVDPASIKAPPAEHVQREEAVDKHFADAQQRRRDRLSSRFGITAGQPVKAKQKHEKKTEQGSQHPPPR